MTNEPTEETLKVLIDPHSPNVPLPEILQECLALFHAARKEHAIAGHGAKPDSPSHAAAVVFGEKHNIPVRPLLDSLMLSCKKQGDAAWQLVEFKPPNLPEEMLCHWHFARGQALITQKKFDQSIIEFDKARQTSDFRLLGSALNNIGNAYNLKREPDKAIDYYNMALATPGYDGIGYVLNHLGIAFFRKKEFDKAIEYHNRAINTPGFETPAYAYSNLGNAFRAKNEISRAIEYYEKALTVSDFDSRGGVYYNLGSTYLESNKLDLAIKYYKQAIETPGFDSIGDALNNLGNAHRKKKEYEEAIHYYQEALKQPGYDAKQLTQLNLVRVFRESGQLDRASELLEIILSAPDSEGKHEAARFLKSLIESEKAKIDISSADEALSDPAKTDRADSAMIERMAEKLQGKEDKYEAYVNDFRLRNRRSETAVDTGIFHCLRGWSSAVTLLEGSDDVHWRGGGYFLQWRNKGIVIDPGFDFLDNFHDAGLHAMEIDSVLVSHNHADHNFDLRAVDDLLYEVYRRANKSQTDQAVNNAGPRPDFRKSRTEIVFDEDTAKGFPEAVTSHRDAPLTFSKAHFQRKRWHELHAFGIHVTVEHFPVEHGDDVPHAVGLKLRMKQEDGNEFVLGFTGDTCYFDGLSDLLQGCDVLLAHISQPDPKEFADETFYKRVHLGYNGVAKLIQETNPRLTLIGEFWAGLADLRVDLIQGLRKRTGRENILPTGLGFNLHIPSLEVNCTECRRKTSFQRLRISPPSVPFGAMGFLCERCIV